MLFYKNFSLQILKVYKSARATVTETLHRHILMHVASQALIWLNLSHFRRKELLCNIYLNIPSMVQLRGTSQDERDVWQVEKS